MTKSNSTKLPEIIIILLIVGVMAALAVPNFGSGTPKPPIRVCNDHVRTIMGALEMYNLDHNADGRLPGSESSEGPSITYKILQAKGYLPEIPKHPGDNLPPEEVYGFDKEGSIYCKYKTLDYTTNTHGYFCNNYVSKTSQCSGACKNPECRSKKIRPE